MVNTTREQPAADVILVIDDEPQIRRVVRNGLADVARRVSEAGTAAEGLDLAAAEQPALIILDLGLPDRDGHDVCRDLRSFTSVPIIVLSARHSDREKEKLLDAGADDYVTKPFSTLELKARVRSLRPVCGRQSGSILRVRLTGILSALPAVAAPARHAPWPRAHDPDSR